MSSLIGGRMGRRAVHGSRFANTRALFLRALAIGLLLGSVMLAAAEAESDPLAAAGALIAQGSVQQAVQTLRGYLQQQPDSADAHRLLGIALALAPQRSAALEALERAVELAPDDPRNHLVFGQTLARFGESARAREEFQATVKLDPSSGPAHEGLAFAAALDGALDLAVRHFSSAIEHAAATDRARLHFLRGRAYRQQERLAAAVSDFEKSVDLDPNLGPAYLEWGRILTESPEPDRADAVLAKAVELLPDDFEARLLLGSQRLRRGHAASAVEHLRVAVQLKPGDRAAGYALGRALRAAGRTEEARTHLESLAHANAGRAVSDADINEAGRLNNQGLELEKRAAYAEALEKYRAAVVLAPQEVGFRRNAALALCRLNRWQEAKVELREVLRIAPGDVDAVKALYVALERAPDDQ